MTHIAALLVAVTAASQLGWGAPRDPVHCSWTRVLPTGEVHYTFLRGGPPSERLYHSVWSREERALLGCAWSDDAQAIREYLSRCRERAQDFSNDRDQSLDLDSLFGAEGRCVPLSTPGEQQLGPVRRGRSAGGLPSDQNNQGHDEGSKVRGHRRAKRGFIVPGTLWCGSGNKAPSYADLGVFAETDSCCREHDQCKHTILSFHSDFGVFNTNIFTMSHCDCDNRFHSCLKEANDSISHVVGYTFFNLLKMNCFEFTHRLQCTQRNWFGMCKETKMALYAEVHPPTLFESTDPTDGDTNSTNATTPADPQLSSVSAGAFTVSTPSMGSPSASVTPLSSNTTDSSERPGGSAPKTTNWTEPNAEMLSCGVYKDLDECRTKILPQQRRYGLQNPESRTLYHCNCTSRLFQTLVKQRRLTEVQAHLLRYVSQSCFLPQTCTAGNRCAAVLLRSDLAQLDRSSRTEVEERHHLQAIQLKLRRPNVKRAKRKVRAVKLHKLCLRLTRPKRVQTAERPKVFDMKETVHLAESRISGPDPRTGSPPLTGQRFRSGEDRLWEHGALSPDRLSPTNTEQGRPSDRRPAGLSPVRGGTNPGKRRRSVGAARRIDPDGG
ncbi:group 3 secretory phospholipase A2 [Echeneis naucrates]|uniref:group 3 secretory phospholipase A2 n=1 Tax=Echeneis naucrates TaxID=173247 RepID=UPI001113AC40|nr:group 3 secretory phospholipase A2 [Echeneis naucrates]